MPSEALYCKTTDSGEEILFISLHCHLFNLQNAYIFSLLAVILCKLALLVLNILRCLSAKIISRILEAVWVKSNSPSAENT